MPLNQPPDQQVGLYAAAIGAAVALVRWLNSNRRTGWKLFTLVTSSMIWGAITGWVLQAAWPQIPTGILCGIVAVVSHAGTEGSVELVRGIVLPLLEKRTKP
jgi:uncharacterized membrane protein YoaK (UPF0700 family)